MKTKFFTYCQNNSGGKFNISEKEGIGPYVIIEALDARHANSRAEEIGLYFNGCNLGADCSCFDNRWFEADEDDGHNIPLIYGLPAETATTDWCKEHVYVHSLDKTFKKIELFEHGK
jgi:hypothetical protein